MITTLIAVLATAVAVFFIVAWAYEFEPPRRFWKPAAPHRVQVPGKPGTVIELVADDGHVFGVVQLQMITRELSGPLTVVFKDFTAFMADRRMTPRDNDDEW